MCFCNIFYTQPLAATLPRQAHPLLWRGLGRLFHSPFFFPFGLGEALFSFFKYFRPLPHSLANIENMSTLFSVKIPLFYLSLQQQLLQSTNSLLFIFSLLFPLIPFFLFSFLCFFFTNFTRSSCFSMYV